jgi:histidine ammonia-lyase
MERVRAGRALVTKLLASGRAVYGITTGFGKLKHVQIEASDAATLQLNLLRSHAVGVGPHAPESAVRLLLLLRLNTLLRGNSGVRPEVCELLLAMLQRNVLPQVPEQGSVGACGDLAPLAHLALVMVGEGEAHVNGVLMPGREALERAGLKALTLEAKEGLALINGTSFSTAVAVLAHGKARCALRHANLAAAMTIEALQGSHRPFDARVAAIRPHPGHARVAERMRALLQNSAIAAEHEHCNRVQDPYSLRCTPQVHGAVEDALQHTGDVFHREMNSATDNPLLFPEDGESLSAGNFHGEAVALAADYAKCAVAELGSIAERRIENLVNPDLSHLPPFLAGGKPGLNSGLMMAQVTAAALVSENKGLAHPASVDSIPTSANQEDHVSMSPIAARTFRAITENVRHVLAVEILAATFALDWQKGRRAGDGVEAARQFLAQEIAPPSEDRLFGKDIRHVRELMDSGRLLSAVLKPR